MSKQPIKIDFVPSDEQAERSRNRKGLTAGSVPTEEEAPGQVEEDLVEDDELEELEDEDEEDELATEEE